MRSRPVFWISLAILAAAGLLFGWQWLPILMGDKDNSANRAAESGRGSNVAALGRLEPESEIIDVGAPAGSRVDYLAVKEGDVVNKGTALAFLDSYAEMSAGRDYARSQLAEAKKRYQAETAAGQAAIAEARLHLRQAEEVALLAIQAQDAETRRALAELEKARLDLKRARQMLADKAISQSKYDADALILRQAEEKHERDKHTLARLKKDRDIKLLLAQAELKSAQAALERAQLSARVDSLLENLKLAEARRERAIIRAPIAGEILKILTRAGESAGKNPILKMGDTQAMFAVAEVYETDVRHVQAGQKASITSKAFPGRTITGKVERIGKLIRKNDVLRIEPTSEVDARVIEVRIRLDDSALAARYNYLQVDILIHVDGS